jgi:hypothetical protein
MNKTNEFSEIGRFLCSPIKGSKLESTLTENEFPNCTIQSNNKLDLSKNKHEMVGSEIYVKSEEKITVL